MVLIIMKYNRNQSWFCYFNKMRYSYNGSVTIINSQYSWTRVFYILFITNMLLLSFCVNTTFSKSLNGHNQHNKLHITSHSDKTTDLQKTETETILPGSKQRHIHGLSKEDNTREVISDFKDQKSLARNIENNQVDNWELKSGPWLEEFEDTAKNENKDIDYMQADDPGGGYGSSKKFSLPPNVNAPIKCPSVPDITNILACDLPSCTTNTDCLIPFHLCCPNGCVSTCTRAVSASVVLDWDVQPMPIDEEKGYSWLIHDDIDYTDEQDSIDQAEYMEQQPCYFESFVIQDGKDFTFEDHPCSCLNGEVFCSVYEGTDSELGDINKISP